MFAQAKSKLASSQRVRHEVGLDEADRGGRATAFPGDRDHLLVQVDPGYGGAPGGQLAGEQPVPAPDIDRRTAPLRHRVQDHPLIVNVVIPVVPSRRFHSPTINRSLHRIRLLAQLSSTGLPFQFGARPSFWPDVPQAQFYWPGVPQAQNRIGPMFRRAISILVSRAPEP